MGLFGNLFSKETCAICGNEVGALKKRKLADGVMCTDCAKGLSPFFDDRKGSTVSDIQAQLAAREENRSNLENFHASMAFGDAGCLLIDRSAGTFVAVADTSDGFMKGYKKVTSIIDVIDKNPDIIRMDQVVDIDLEITETSRENKRTVDGKQVSYNPKDMVYMYMFTLVMKVEHPYINTIRIPLNNGAVQIPNQGERLRRTLGEEFKSWLTGTKLPDLQAAELYDLTSLKDFLLKVRPYGMPDYSYGFKCSIKNWDAIKEYETYLNMGALIMQVFGLK